MASVSGFEDPTAPKKRLQPAAPAAPTPPNPGGVRRLMAPPLTLNDGSDMLPQTRPNQGMPGNRGSGEPTASNPGGPVRPPAFNPALVPQSVPQPVAQPFIQNNPGDYGRMPSAFASAPQIGAGDFARLTQRWNDYQSGRGGLTAQNIRDFTSMDDRVVYDAQGRPSTDQNFENGVSTNEASYRSPWVDAFIGAGFGKESDRAALTQELISSGKLLYEPGTPRSFGTTANGLPTGSGALAGPSTPNQSGPGGQGSLTNTGGLPGIQMPGQVFDDPTSKLLEDLIKAQIGQLTGPVNDPLRGQYQDSLQGLYNNLSTPEHGAAVPGGQQSSQDQYRQLLQNQINRFANPSADENALMGSMRSQFNELSQTPGYSPEERAILNTQTFEPIEALRRASQERERDRTSAAGYLPTSGVHNARMTSSDRFFDQERTVANRDLAVKEIDRRDDDLARALTIGTGLANRPLEIGQNAIDAGGALGDFDQNQTDRADARLAKGSTIAGLLAALSQGTRVENDQRTGSAITLAQTLQRLPAQAQADAMAVLNGTAPPESLLPAIMQLAGASQGQNNQYYSMIGDLLEMFD